MAAIWGVLLLGCLILRVVGASEDGGSTPSVVTIPDVPKPGYLKSVLDRTFGSKVTRITGDPGDLIPNLDARWNEVARHQYSKTQVWNADETLLFLGRHHGFPSALFLDGSSYEPLFGRNEPPGTELRWHPHDPSTMVFVSDQAIGSWDVVEDTRTIWATFPGYSGLSFGPWEGNFSLDGNRIALQGKQADRPVIFVYDLSTGQKLADLDLTGIEVDWASVAASGELIVVNGNVDGANNDQTAIFDLTGNRVGELWAEYGRPSHFDLTLDTEGEDVAVGVSKSGPDDGRVIKRRLRDGRVTVLTRGGYASHVSTRNTRRAGWAFVTYQHRGPDWPPFFDELVAVKLDGSFTSKRITHLHTHLDGYLTQAHAVPSPSGTRVLWASNWREEEGAPISAFVVEVGE